MSIDWAEFEREQEAARLRGEEEGRLIVAIRQAQSGIIPYREPEPRDFPRFDGDGTREMQCGVTNGAYWCEARQPTPAPRSTPLPAPNGRPTDPWESLANLVGRMGGGFTLPAPEGAITSFAPETQRRFSSLIWLALLVAAGGGGYWWYTQRKGGKRSNHSRGGES